MHRSLKREIFYFYRNGYTMKIERRKVESVGEFSPKTKAKLVALLGLSAALSVPAEPQGSDAVIPAPPTDSTNAIAHDSTVSSSISSDTTNIQYLPWDDPNALAGILEDDVPEEDMVHSAVDAAVERNVGR